MTVTTFEMGKNVIGAVLTSCHSMTRIDMNPATAKKRNRWGKPQRTQGEDISEKDVTDALLKSARDHQAKSNPRHNSQSSELRSKKARRDDERYNSIDKNERGPQEERKEDQKPNFAVSGALSKDVGSSGRLYKGVLLKFQEPLEARTPSIQWRLYVFKGEDQLDTLHISKQSAYLIGRNEDIADIPVQHPSCSSQHAVLQYRALQMSDGSGRLNCLPYIMDLESTNGTFLNGVRIDSARYYQLKTRDVLKFGMSSRDYVLLSADT